MKNSGFEINHRDVTTTGETKVMLSVLFVIFISISHTFVRKVIFECLKYKM